MLATAPNFIDWLAYDVCQTSPDNVRLWLWVALLTGLVTATIQFVLMMATRWGNSDPTGKALMCSVLIHLSLSSGAVVVSPPKAVLAILNRPKRPEKDVVRKVVIEGLIKTEDKKSGNTPVWERLLEKPTMEFARLDRAPLEFEALTAPDRTRDPLTRPELSVPDIKHTPDLPPARPELEQSAEVGVKLESSAPIKIEDTSVEARPEVNVPTLSALRRKVERSGLAEIPVERTPSAGAVERILPTPDLSRQVASIPLPSTAVIDPKSMLTKDSLDEKIQRRSGPIPAEAPKETAGASSAAKTEDSAIGSLGQPKFERLKTRTPKMEDFGGTQRLEPDRKPSTPLPIPDPVISVREGIASKAPLDGPKPNAIKPNFEPTNRSQVNTLPPTYRLRNLAKRAETALKFGGTEASERTVESSLKWLALHQSPEGYWDADGFSSMCPEGDRCVGRGQGRTIDAEGRDRPEQISGADSGITGLTVLAFLGAGYTHEEGPYADEVDRAITWLIRQQRDDGYLGGRAARYEQMYCHAMATYALAEALGMQTDRATDRRLKIPLQKALQFILSQQNPIDGGWRYEKGQYGDMSMFGWQLMALKSGEIAGIPIPEVNRKLLIQFLKEHSTGPRKGLAAYRIVDPQYQQLPPTPAMTAEALFCKQMLGIQRTNPQSVEAIEYLMPRIPSHRTEDLYYWYYGTLAVYQYGGDEWLRWNSSLREYLIQDQRKSGHAAGSWDPKAPWGTYGGRVFATALSTLCLEVYYRFLPLYQVQKGTDDLGN